MDETNQKAFPLALWCTTRGDQFEHLVTQGGESVCGGMERIWSVRDLAWIRNLCPECDALLQAAMPDKCPTCRGVPVAPEVDGCHGCADCDYSGTRAGWDEMQGHYREMAEHPLDLTTEDDDETD